MTKKSKSDWQTDVSTLLPDNTTGDISPADIRVVLGDLFDSVEFPAVTFPYDSDLATDTVVAPSIQVGDNVFCLNDGQFKVYRKVSVQPATNYITGSDGSFYEEIYALQSATVAEWQSKVNNRLLDTSVVWDSMQETALTVTAGAIDWDLSTGYDFAVTLTENSTLNMPTNITVGQRGRIRVTQDTTGGWSLSYGSGFVFPGGSAPSNSVSAGSEDLLYYDVISPSKIYLNLVGGVA